MTDAVIEALRQGERLVDDGLLKAGGRRLVLGKIAALEAQTGRVARVWTRPPGTPLPDVTALFAAAALEDGRELLLVFNGRDMRAVGWRLDEPAITAALADGRRGLEENWAHGVVASLIALDLAAHDARTRRGPEGGAAVVGLSLGGLLLVGAVVASFALRRRRTRAAASAGAQGEGAA